MVVILNVVVVVEVVELVVVIVIVIVIAITIVVVAVRDAALWRCCYVNDSAGGEMQLSPSRSELFSKFEPIELTSTKDPSKVVIGSVPCTEFVIPVLPSGSELTISIMSNW